MIPPYDHDEDYEGVKIIGSRSKSGYWVLAVLSSRSVDHKISCFELEAGLKVIKTSILNAATSERLWESMKKREADLEARFKLDEEVRWEAFRAAEGVV